MIRASVICLAVILAVAAFGPGAASASPVAPPHWRWVTFTQPSASPTFAAAALGRRQNPYAETQRGSAVIVTLWGSLAAISLLT